jgi:hypothetical protein
VEAVFGFKSEQTAEGGCYSGDSCEENGGIHRRKVAEMKMIFIFGGRVVLSVSQSKI